MPNENQKPTESGAMARVPPPPDGSPKLGPTDIVGILCALAAGKITESAAGRYLPNASRMVETAIQKGDWWGSLAELQIAAEEAEEAVSEYQANVELTRGADENQSKGNQT